jgi:PAS domain S-box-containing protein
MEGAGCYRRQRLLEQYLGLMGEAGAEDPTSYDTTASYEARDARWPEAEEAEIMKVLALTGKYKAEDELNCGACGYYSCREKAKAVIRGLAEPEMCMPYMKSRAETMGNLVVNETPNGIIGVKPDLTVVMTNPALCRLTGLSADQLVGRMLPYIFEREPFLDVFVSRTTLIREAKAIAGIPRSKEAYFHLQSKDMVVLLVSDLSAEHKDKEALTKVRRETAEKAGRVIDNQIRVAQQVAGLMGEAAAETKVLLSKLIKQMEEGSDK